jgi:saccharopine dehydrogenase-like NADP-dependent oxidoreductase
LPQKDLLYATELVEINAALTMEGYANRDSLSYQKTYHLEGTHKIRRGTLRYKGYCTLIAAFKEIGLFTE